MNQVGWDESVSVSVDVGVVIVIESMDARLDTDNGRQSRLFQ